MKPAHPLLSVLLIAAFLMAPGGAHAAPAGADSLEYHAERVSWGQDEMNNLGLAPAAPGRLDARNVPAAMRRLAYERRGLSWSDKKSVFPGPLRERLAPLVARQWALATAGERVAFRVSGRGGKVLLAGDTFLTEEGMHWRLTVLNYKERPLGDFNLASEPWRLSPIQEQRYHHRERYKNLREEMTNWLVLIGFRPGASRADAPRPETPPPAAPGQANSSAPDPAIRQKLDLLDELRREGLITDSDYEKKRGQILAPGTLGDAPEK